MKSKIKMVFSYNNGITIKTMFPQTSWKILSLLILFVGIRKQAFTAHGNLQAFDPVETSIQSPNKWNPPSG